MKSGAKQAFRFAGLTVVVLGLAFVTAHQLRGSKTLKLSVQVQTVPERIQTWVYAARNSGEPDVAATRTRVLVRLPGKPWSTVSKIDSSAVKFAACAGGEFVAVLRYAQRPKPNVPGTLLLEIYKTSGALLDRWSLSWEYDRPLPAVAVFREGPKVALGWADVGAVQIFTPGQTRPATVDLFAEDEYSLERSLYLACNDSTNELLVLATRRAANPTAGDTAERSSGAALFWLTPDGSILRELPVEAEAVSAFHFDPVSRVIVVGGTDFPAPDRPLPFAEIRTADGQALTRVEHVTPEQFASTADRHLCVLADPSRAVAVDLAQRLELWRHTREAENRSILDATVLNSPASVAFLSADVLFQNNRFVYSEPTVSVVDTKGHEIGSTSLPETLTTRAELVATADGKLRILTQNRIWTVLLAQ